jgi:hypothetical protein
LAMWSGRRDSNPRHSAWEADTLPAELLPLGAERVIADRARGADRCPTQSDTLHDGVEYALGVGRRGFGYDETDITDGVSPTEGSEIGVERWH